MAEEKMHLTKDGMKKLNDELRNLIDVVKPDVLEMLAFARAQGDLSENADYDAAKNKQAEVEGRIVEIENILANCIVIEDSPKSNKIVALGTKVKFKDLSDGEDYTYGIVGTVEADPLAGNISNASPLGEAMLGKHVGDKAVVKTLTPYEVEIISIDLLNK